MKKNLIILSMLMSLMMIGSVSAAELNVPEGYTTIQDAINVATSGDTINVSAGTYVENIVINVEGLTLQSADGAESTTINATDSSDYVVNIIADGVTLNGFTITGLSATNTILPNNAAIITQGVDDCTITNNILTGNHEVAISLFGGVGGAYSDYNTVSNNVINGPAGIDTFGIKIKGSSNTISGNEIYNTDAAIHIWSCSDTETASPDYNIISGNTIGPGADTASYKYGIEIKTGQHNEVTGNTISVTRAGIHLYTSSAMKAEEDFDPRPANNIISDNTITGGEVGICLLEGANTNTISGNTISETTIAGILGSLSRDIATDWAVVGNNPSSHLVGTPQQYLQITDNTFKDNTLDNCGHGIAMEYADDNIIGQSSHRNTIKNNADTTAIDYHDVAFTADYAGIYFDANSDGNVVNYNKIVDNNGGLGNGNTATLDAENNWWGDLDPSDQVSDNVDYDPWAYNENMDVDEVGPSITNVYIKLTNPNLDSTLVKVYATITDYGSGVDYATLYYRIGDEEIQSTTFTGPFLGGYAGIVNGNPKDNVLVEYHIKAVDNVENYVWYPGPSTWESFIYDGSAPTTILIIGVPKYGELDFITSDTQITLGCEDTISGCDKTYYRIGEGNLNEYSAPFNVSGDDGTYSISYYSVDNAGNVETEKSVEVILDNSKPTTTIIPDGSDWTKINVPFTLSCDDGTGSGCAETSYKIIDASEKCDTVELTESSEIVDCLDNEVCMKKVCYRSIDNLGNTEDIKTSVVFNVDKEKPITTDNAVSTWQASDVTVTLTANDGLGSGVDSTKYCVDTNGTCTPNTEGISVLVECAVDSVCEQYVRYQSTDNVGNVEDVKTSALIKIDKQKPTTTNNAPSTWQASDVTVTLTANDGLGSGVVSTTYCVYNEGETACTDYQTGTIVSVTCDADSVCEQYVRYYSTDNVENVEAIQTSSVVRIDKTGPVTTVESPIQDSWFSTDFVMFFSDTDVGVGGLGTCYYSINEGTLQTRTCGGVVTVTVGEEEANDCSTEGEDTCRIEAYAEDSLGNIGNHVEVNYSIDWTWPTEIVSSSPSGEVTADNTILEIETNKWAKCKYDTQSKSYEDMANNMTSVDGINHEAGLTNLEDGMYVYYVRCQDNVGNKMRTSETIVFTVDTSGNYNLTIDLHQGWDFFFLPRIILETIDSLLGNYSVQNVLSSIEGSYIGIMYHYDEEDGWSSYVPDRVTNTGWPLNDLTEFNDTTNSPYWIQMIQSDRLELA